MANSWSIRERRLVMSPSADSERRCRASSSLLSSAKYIWITCFRFNHKDIHSEMRGLLYANSQLKEPMTAAVQMDSWHWVSTMSLLVENFDGWKRQIIAKLLSSYRTIEPSTREDSFYSDRICGTAWGARRGTNKIGTSQEIRVSRSLIRVRGGRGVFDMTRMNRILLQPKRPS